MAENVTKKQKGKKSTATSIFSVAEEALCPNTKSLLIIVQFDFFGQFVDGLNFGQDFNKVLWV